ncbi:MAG: hypothetical protein ACI4UB_02340 [Limosilactobacillus sp.]
MRKTHRLNRRASLAYGAILLPINTFLKLYLRDQEKYEANHRPAGKQQNGINRPK